MNDGTSFEMGAETSVKAGVGLSAKVAFTSYVIVLILSYAVFEISARLILPTRISMIQELDASINHMKENDIEVEQFIENYR